MSYSAVTLLTPYLVKHINHFSMRRRQCTHRNEIIHLYKHQEQPTLSLIDPRFLFQDGFAPPDDEEIDEGAQGDQEEF